MYIQKFKNNGLLAHESEVNKLQDEGDRLVEIIKHPGSPAITVRLSHTIVTWSDKFSLNSNAWAFFFFFLNQIHRNAVQNEWQAFLNLCLAQETHLDNIEDYKKVKSRVVLPCHPIHPNPLNI